MTVFGGFLLLLLIAGVAILGIRIVPVYVENYNIQRVLIDMVDESKELLAMDPHSLKVSIYSRLHVSGVHYAEASKMKIGIKRSENGRRITIDYLVKRPVVGNMEILMTFHNDVELVRH